MHAGAHTRNMFSGLGSRNNTNRTASSPYSSSTASSPYSSSTALRKPLDKKSPSDYGTPSNEHAEEFVPKEPSSNHISNGSISDHKEGRKFKELSRSPMLVFRSFGRPPQQADSLKSNLAMERTVESAEPRSQQTLDQVDESQMMSIAWTDESEMESKPVAEEAGEINTNHEIETRTQPTVQSGNGMENCEEAHLDSMVEEAITTEGDHHKSKEHLDDVTDDARLQVALAATKVAVAEALVQHLETKIYRLEGELRDVAAVEATLYSVTAEHVRSSMKVHFPAHRLAELFAHSCKHRLKERRPMFAKNILDGIILVARACANDIPRLAFWWSNTVVLRELILTTLENAGVDVESGVEGCPQVRTPCAGGDKCEEGLTRAPQNSHNALSRGMLEDLTQPSACTAALERVEAWVYSKLIESVWSQVFIPHLKGTLDTNSAENLAFTGVLYNSSFAKTKRSLILKAGGRSKGISS